jgi:transcriptional regulator with XRE-family HTH domain
MLVLRNARREQGVTQEALAETADFDRTYPSLLERGLRQPTLTYLFGIADALGMDPEELVRLVRARLQS